jgi:parvulin-like peptidyl-prolyl isomerase
MASAKRSSLSAEQEAEAQVLAQRIRELAEDEFVQIARLLVSKADRDIFGETEFQIRDILLKAGAKALQEHLRQKKTATADAR